MLNITLCRNDEAVTVSESGTIRVRSATPLEMKFELKDENAKGSRLDHDDGVFYVKESVDSLVRQIQPVLPTLDLLLTPHAWPLWFNAKLGDGPLYLSPKDRSATVQSALNIGNNIQWQYVKNSPQEVRDIIAKHGGHPRPVLNDDIGIEAIKRLDETVPAITDWDAGT